MNDNPTSRQEDALKDLAKHPTATLAERGERLGTSRSGVHQMLVSLQTKHLVENTGGAWVLTFAGRKWLRPTMGTRR